MTAGDFYRCGLCAEHMPWLEFGDKLSLRVRLTGLAKFGRSVGRIGQRGSESFIPLLNGTKLIQNGE
jgi:hypothetical protein